MKSVTSSCKILGHTAEAAKEARKKVYALSDYFGPHSIFFTVTPDDECNFRVQMNANQRKEIVIPTVIVMKLIAFQILDSGKKEDKISRCMFS